MPSVWRKTNGNWVKVKTIYRKTNGSWQSVKRVWRKSEGTWRLVFLQALTPSIQTRVEISTTLSSTTQRRTFVGKLYHWTNASGVTYRFTKSTDNLTFANISGATGTSTNPASGGSNTLDQYSLTQTDVVANSTNYYNYVSTATNSTFGTEQTSAALDLFVLEAPRDLSLTATAGSKSIKISWTNDTYSGRYEYQYKLSSSATWSTTAFVAPGTTTTEFTTPATLTPSTSYDFRVRGWTGNIDNGGYYGNWKEIAKSTTAVQAPNPPTDILQDTTFTGTTFIDYKWTAPLADLTHDLAESYDHAVSTSNSVAPTTTTNTTNTYGDATGLTQNTNYYVWVRSKNSGGNSAWAVSAAIKTNLAKPPADVSTLALKASGATTTSLTFSYTVPAGTTTNNVASTIVYAYGTTDTAPTTNTVDWEDSVSATNDGEFTIGSELFPLTANTDYYVFAKGKNADGFSPNWKRATAKTLTASNPPTTATGLTVNNQSPSGFGFSFTIGGGTPTKVEVAYSTSTTTPTTTDNSGNINTWNEITSTDRSYRFIGLTPGTTYYAFVRSSNTDGSATAARSGSITTLAAPTLTRPTLNFQRSEYLQLTVSKSRTRVGTTSNSTLTISPNNTATINGSGTVAGNLATAYSSTSNTTVTLANLGAPYDGTRTVASVSAGSPTTSFTTTAVASGTSQANTPDADGTILGNTRLRWGFNNTGITVAGTGTYSVMNSVGIEYEIYTALTGGTQLGFLVSKENSGTNDPILVNNTGYRHVVLSGREALNNNANPRYLQVRGYALDYDNGRHETSWSTRL